MSLVPTEQYLFRSGEGGYNTYRIPALAVGSRGTVFAFCEARRDGCDDSGTIHMLLRRSFDGGRTWADPQRILAEEDMTCGNPAPVVDRDTGKILLLFCKNLAQGHEGLIFEGKAPRTVWITESADDGASWGTPREITADVKKHHWTWYATGPCHGIQLRTGRLLVPCDYAAAVNLDHATDPLYSHVIYSDDHGTTWRIGGCVGPGVEECCVVEGVDGGVYINCRTDGRRPDLFPKRRQAGWSGDGGQSFHDFRADDALVEPYCQGSVLRLSTKAEHGKNRVLFSNPACATARRNLTVRVSYDECQTWPVACALQEGPSAYSDLAVTHAMDILCLYERGRGKDFEHMDLALARFSLQELAALEAEAGIG